MARYILAPWSKQSFKSSLNFYGFDHFPLKRESFSEVIVDKRPGGGGVPATRRTEQQNEIKLTFPIAQFQNLQLTVLMLQSRWTCFDFRFRQFYKQDILTSTLLNKCIIQIYFMMYLTNQVRCYRCSHISMNFIKTRQDWVMTKLKRLRNQNWWTEYASKNKRFGK